MIDPQGTWQVRFLGRCGEPHFIPRHSSSAAVRLDSFAMARWKTKLATSIQENQKSKKDNKP